mgnify:CR=1 FL=1
MTATFGNLAAYAQSNLKRMLAYSTIAHAGYMLIGLVAGTGRGISAVLFYLPAYGRTMAELPSEVKNQISHRARAVQAALPYLRALLRNE